MSARCTAHPAYEPDYCPLCGTAAVIGGQTEGGSMGKTTFRIEPLGNPEVFGWSVVAERDGEVVGSRILSAHTDLGEWLNRRMAEAPLPAKGEPTGVWRVLVWGEVNADSEAEAHERLDDGDWTVLGTEEVRPVLAEGSDR